MTTSATTIFQIKTVHPHETVGSMLKWEGCPFRNCIEDLIIQHLFCWPCDILIYRSALPEAVGQQLYSILITPAPGFFRILVWTAQVSREFRTLRVVQARDSASLHEKAIYG